MELHILWIIMNLQYLVSPCWLELEVVGWNYMLLKVLQRGTLQYAHTKILLLGLLYLTPSGCASLTAVTGSIIAQILFLYFSPHTLILNNRRLQQLKVHFHTVNTLTIEILSPVPPPRRVSL